MFEILSKSIFMKNHLLCSLAMAALLSAAACQKPVVENPSLELSRTEVSVPAEGGSYSVAYRVVNPTEGAKISVSQPEVGWVSDVAFDDEEISFTVSENEAAEERSADVVVSYPGVSPDAVFTIVQEPGVPAPFTIMLKENNPASFVVDIIPLDKEMYYVAFGTTQEYLDQNGIDSDEALYQDDLTYFKNLGMYASQGDKTGAEFSASPDTETVLYVYGINPETSERITDIVYEKFTTPPVEMLDVQFALTNLEVEGSMVTFSVDPGSYEGYWTAYAFAASSLDPEVSIYDYCSSAYASSIAPYQYVGYPSESILEETCLKGARDGISFPNLEPETDYVLAVFAVNEDCLAASEPSTEEVTTGAVEPSDNRLTITVSDVKATTAHLDIQASNDDPYAYLVYYASEFEGMSDDEIMEYAIMRLSMTTASGNVSKELVDLPSSEDLVVLAFGYAGGTVPTTDLFRADFTTLDAEIGAAAIELRFDEYYEINAAAEALADVDSDMAEALDFYAMLGMADGALPLYAVTDASEYYYALFDYDEAEYDDDAYLSQYLTNYTPGTPGSLYMVSFGTESYFAGVAVDENGNAGPVFKTEPFTLTADGVSDDMDSLIAFVETYYGSDTEAASVKTASVLPANNSSATLSTYSYTTSAEYSYDGGEPVAVRPGFMNALETEDAVAYGIDKVSARIGR